ncbi:MAG: DUF2059 domain-containing protein [Chitinispirillales bacterium]|jgi:hypothetical protein|nr:DUF2059 domain-containing protein [Chitinispirillales bacterium]
MEVNGDIAKLMKLMNVEGSMLQFLEIGIKMGIDQIEAECEGFPSEEYYKRIMQKVNMGILLNQMMSIYSRYYTREEIAGLIAFYETPVGAKQIKEIPAILQEIIVANQIWVERIAENINNEFGEIS